MSDLLLKSYDCTGVGVTICQDDKSKQFYPDLENNDKYDIASIDDGDVTRLEVISDVAAICEAKYGKNNVDLIVADGAPSLEYHQEDHQEVYAQKIILSEIITGLECLKRHGKFVIKIFDTFTKFSRSVVFLFSKMFNQVKIIKPRSSRATNSEKYLVGIDLMLMDEKRIDLLANLQFILTNFKDGYNCEEFINLEVDSRFDKTFGCAMTELANEQIICLTKILDEIDKRIFKVAPEPRQKEQSKGKGKGKGNSKGKRAAPYVPQIRNDKEYVSHVRNDQEYSPFDDESIFPD